MPDDKYLYLTAQELAKAVIRIENTGLQSIFWTMPRLKETGQPIGNIKRIQIDMDIDKNGSSHITAKVTLYDMSDNKPKSYGRWGPVAEEVTLENNPDLLLDVEVAEVEMRWKQSDLWKKK
jgi:hypothetical protein